MMNCCNDNYNLDWFLGQVRYLLNKYGALAQQMDEIQTDINALDPENLANDIAGIKSRLTESENQLRAISSDLSNFKNETNANITTLTKSVNDTLVSLVTLDNNIAEKFKQIEEQSKAIEDLLSDFPISTEEWTAYKNRVNEMEQTWTQDVSEIRAQADRIEEEANKIQNMPVTPSEYEDMISFLSACIRGGKQIKEKQSPCWEMQESSLIISGGVYGNNPFLRKSFHFSGIFTAPSNAPTTIEEEQIILSFNTLEYKEEISENDKWKLVDYSTTQYPDLQGIAYLIRPGTDELNFMVISDFRAYYNKNSKNAFTFTVTPKKSIPTKGAYLVVDIFGDLKYTKVN